MARNLYKGFSSFEFQANKTFKLADVELVKMDLLNHIFTKRGERVMMPSFGTRIPDMLFEPLDDQTVDVIVEELRAVFEYDPRVTLLDLNVYPKYDENAIYGSARLFYNELNVTDLFELNIQFES